jgi:uncharacterized membrane-anchored protein
MRNKIAVIATILVLGLVNWSIAGKEKHLQEGKVVYLQLAPVDPRSLMQGDYMALRFAMANDVYNVLPKIKGKHWRRDVDAADGFVVAKLDDKAVASFSRLQNDTQLTADEILLRYRVRAGAVKFATNAFFFQEGHAKIYQAARYGEFRVDTQGELLLTNMYDKDLRKLEVQKVVAR